ncbi:hypothetical protein V8B97DRAFT_2009122 [Scleroderma yunnanense]
METANKSHHSSPKEVSDNSTPSTSPVNTTSPGISVDEFVGYVQVFNNFESWAALRWDTESWDESLSKRQDVINAMKTQAEMVLLAKEMYGLPLLLSFNTFLNQSQGPLTIPAHNTPAVWHDHQTAGNAQCPVCQEHPHLGRYCPAPLVNLSSSSSSDSEPSLDQHNPQFWTLCSPRVSETPLPDNPIPACALHDLTYIRTATTMADKIIALTGDTHRPWVHFFMAVKDNPVN